MLSRLFGRRDVPRPELTLDDVAALIPDRATAAAALAELQRLQRLDMVDVYLPAGWVAANHRDFNVWIGHAIIPGGERITLAEWCTRWLADRAPDPDGGNGGAA